MPWKAGSKRLHVRAVVGPVGAGGGCTRILRVANSASVRTDLAGGSSLRGFLHFGQRADFPSDSVTTVNDRPQAEHPMIFLFWRDRSSLTWAPARNPF